MADYLIKLLAKDDSVRRSVQVELENDEDCWTYLVEHHRQSAVEVWRDGERIIRRVSPAHELRTKGYRRETTVVGPETPSLINRSSVHQFQENHGMILSRERTRLEAAAEMEFERLRDAFGAHAVWIRADTHPLEPTNVSQHVRFSFGVTAWEEGTWAGWMDHRAYSRERDGAAILDDLMDLISKVIIESPIIIPSPGAPFLTPLSAGLVVRDGLFITTSHSTSWHLPPESRNS